jgi:molecular chaperone GrpE (heat shock protein)
VHLLKIMERLADVEEWRAKQKDPGDLNHPSRVWVKFQHSIKQADRRAAEKAEKKPSMAEQTSTELARALERISELEAETEEQNERIKELDEELAGAREISAPAATEPKTLQEALGQ